MVTERRLHTNLVRHVAALTAIAAVMAGAVAFRRSHGIRDRAQRTCRPSPAPRCSTGPDPAERGLLAPGVYLYWLPLGAGDDVVRLSGRAFEAITSRMQHRSAGDLYHSALVVVTDDARYVIEMTPIPAGDEHERGVVAEGAVGSRWARPLRVFRYEVHRWRGGEIADVEWAVGSPVKVSGDPGVARRVLDLVSSVPTPVWGRDELRTGEMWNSNSVTSWLLASAGIELEDTRPPRSGRAPGWDAGRATARRTDRRGPGLPNLVERVSA